MMIYQKFFTRAQIKKENFKRVKKFLVILIYFILSIKFSLGMSPEYEKQLYLGCYPESKKFIGKKKAQKYCTCVVNILSKKYSDSEIDKIFKKTKNEVIKTTEFASKYCEANKG